MKSIAANVLDARSFDQSLLLDKRIILDDKFDSAKQIVSQNSEPVAALIASGVVRSENFYRQLAEVYQLDFVENINLALNPEEVEAFKVPSHILTAARIFPYKENGRLKIALSTPFADPEAVQNVRAYVGQLDVDFVITHPAVINRALEQLFYREFQVAVEDRLATYHQRLTTNTRLVLNSCRVVIALFVITGIGVLLGPNSVILTVFIALNFMYIYLNGIKLLTFVRSLRRTSVAVAVTDQEVAALTDAELPVYTILVPLKDEAEMVEQLTANLMKINYPKNKLDIKFLLPLQDQKTAEALRQLGVGAAGRDASLLGEIAQLILVPPGIVDTKPRICNYGLRFARGVYTVIYDAEDRPEPDQLRKSISGFSKTTLDTICLQAKLNFYNSRQNILTRFFTLEYGMWYDFFLPGLQSLDSPLPLGGTSNHFITSALKRMGEWDPFNVTEDADLGMRIFRLNQRTKILDSHTFEEANSQLLNWLRQRARWERGFFQTFITHVQQPVKLYRQLGFRRFVLGVTVFWTNFFLPFINPFLWGIFILYYIPGSAWHGLEGLQYWAWLIAVANLILGNGLHILNHLVAALRLRRYDLAPWALLIPIYWLLLSAATYYAIYDIFFRPFYWAKTKHGLDKT